MSDDDPAGNPVSNRNGRPVHINTGAPPIVPNKQIFPNTGDFPMDCGNCGWRSWAVHVTPLPELGTARVSEVVCTRCLRHFRLDDQGCLEKGGRITINSKGVPA